MAQLAAPVISVVTTFMQDLDDEQALVDGNEAVGGARGLREESAVGPVAGGGNGFSADKSRQENQEIASSSAPHQIHVGTLSLSVVIDIGRDLAEVLLQHNFEGYALTILRECEEIGKMHGLDPTLTFSIHARACEVSLCVYDLLLQSKGVETIRTSPKPPRDPASRVATPAVEGAGMCWTSLLSPSPQSQILQSPLHSSRASSVVPPDPLPLSTSTSMSSCVAPVASSSSARSSKQQPSSSLSPRSSRFPPIPGAVRIQGGNDSLLNSAAQRGSSSSVDGISVNDSSTRNAPFILDASNISVPSRSSTASFGSDSAMSGTEPFPDYLQSTAEGSQSLGQSQSRSQGHSQQLTTMDPLSFRLNDLLENAKRSIDGAIAIHDRLHDRDIVEPCTFSPLLEMLAEVYERAGEEPQALTHLMHAEVVCERSLGVEMMQ